MLPKMPLPIDQNEGLHINVINKQINKSLLNFKLIREILYIYIYIYLQILEYNIIFILNKYEHWKIIYFYSLQTKYKFNIK